MSLALWILATCGSALVLTQSTIAAPLRDWLDDKKRRAAYEQALRDHLFNGGEVPTYRSGKTRGFFAKLVNCPMCSGFWLGLAWAAILGTRGVLLACHAFGGSIVSAVAVAAWILLQEAHQALALWRYNHPPRKEDR